MKCLRAFDMGEVTVLDGYCVNALEKEIRYLTSFDPDRLLAGFRETAGLDTKNAVRYGGWEKMLIGGHTMGHYLSAMAQAYANPGVSAEDKEKILGLLTYICDELLKCQNHSAGKPGFLFGAAMTGEGGVEAQFDRVEKGQTNIITESWVPWYTMHKLLAGLVSVWEYVRLESALETAKGIGDWTYNRASGWTEQVHKTVLSIEYGGMNDALYELFACTGIEKYAEAAGYFDDEELFGLIAGGGKDVLNNRHANTTIPKFLGALNRYVTVHGKMMDGRKRDESRFFEYAAAFWDMVVERHTYITGGNSEWEHFGADYVLNGERTACNNETCNVHNMLKLTRGLFMITGEKKYADYYENAFYNTILSSQDPSTGMTTYFQPMANGYFKTYSEPFTKFWCCTGTGMENFTKLNDSIYFHGEDERKRIYVNMYLTSLIEAEEYGISLKLEADLPYDEKVALEITAKEESADVDLCFRIPDWLDKGKKPGRFILMKNGQAVECEETCGYALLRGPFETQDVISFVLPMTVRACGLPDDERVFGFKYGPVVLSSDLGDERMDTTVTGVDVTVPARRIPGREYITLPEGASRQDFVTDTQRFFRKTGDGRNLSFCPEGTDIEFSPHFSKHGKRYGIYYRILTSSETEEMKREENLTVKEAVDTVMPGYGQYENDTLHNMEECDTVSVTNEGTYRYCAPGGHFSYRMAVEKGVENVLTTILRQRDNGRPLKITVGDTVVFDDRIRSKVTDVDYDFNITLPVAEIDRAVRIETDGREYDVVSIRFEGSPKEQSAALCEHVKIVAVHKNND